MDKIFLKKNQLISNSVEICKLLCIYMTFSYFFHKILRMHPVVDLGGARGPPPLSEPNFFHFHAVLGGNRPSPLLATSYPDSLSKFTQCKFNSTFSMQPDIFAENYKL